MNLLQALSPWLPFRVAVDEEDIAGIVMESPRQPFAEIRAWSSYLDHETAMAERSEAAEDPIEDHTQGAVRRPVSRKSAGEWPCQILAGLSKKSSQSCPLPLLAPEK